MRAQGPFSQSPSFEVISIKPQAYQTERLLFRQYRNTPVPHATLQSLLAHRFGLRAHREMAELPVYVLMIAKRGARMRELSPEEQIPKYPANASETARGTIQDVLSMVRIFADRLVVDEIGLTGRYEYPNPRPREIAAQLGEGPRAPVSLLMASLQRMGLKLQPGKRKVETLVIDRVDRPLAN